MQPGLLKCTGDQIPARIKDSGFGAHSAQIYPDEKWLVHSRSSLREQQEVKTWTELVAAGKNIFGRRVKWSALRMCASDVRILAQARRRCKYRFL
jgi:hypothetical protein